MAGTYTAAVADAAVAAAAACHGGVAPYRRGDYYWVRAHRAPPPAAPVAAPLLLRGGARGSGRRDGRADGRSRLAAALPAVETGSCVIGAARTIRSTRRRRRRIGSPCTQHTHATLSYTGRLCTGVPCTSEPVYHC